MTTEKAVWIDAMGAPEVIIEATFDRDNKRVLVDNETVWKMVNGTRAAQMTDETTTEALVYAIRMSPRDGELYDVTEVGGGFDHWIENIVTAQPETDITVPSDQVRVLREALVASQFLGISADDPDGRALDVLDELTLRHASIVIDNAFPDSHVPILIDQAAREALRGRLMEPDMVGVGYTAFLTWALRISRDLHDIIARAAHDAATDSGGCRHTPGAKPACEAEADLAMAAEGSWTR